MGPYPQKVHPLVQISRFPPSRYILHRFIFPMAAFQNITSNPLGISGIILSRLHRIFPFLLQQSCLSYWELSQYRFVLPLYLPIYSFSLSIPLSPASSFLYQYQQYYSSHSKCIHSSSVLISRFRIPSFQAHSPYWCYFPQSYSGILQAPSLIQDF